MDAPIINRQAPISVNMDLVTPSSPPVQDEQLEADVPDLTAVAPTSLKLVPT